MKTCQWQEGYRRCGSYAFNLRDEGIDQGEYCDKHYWQDQAKKATLVEREACAKILELERDDWEDYFASEESLEEEDFRSMTQARIDTLNDMARTIRARK